MGWDRDERFKELFGPTKEDDFPSPDEIAGNLDEEQENGGASAVSEIIGGDRASEEKSGEAPVMSEILGNSDEASTEIIGLGTREEADPFVIIGDVKENKEHEESKEDKGSKKSVKKARSSKHKRNRHHTNLSRSRKHTRASQEVKTIR